MSTIRAAAPATAAATAATASAAHCSSVHRAESALATLLATRLTTLHESAARHAFQRTLQLADPDIQLELLAAAAHRTTFR